MNLFQLSRFTGDILLPVVGPISDPSLERFFTSTGSQNNLRAAPVLCVWPGEPSSEQAKRVIKCKPRLPVDSRVCFMLNVYRVFVNVLRL